MEVIEMEINEIFSIVTFVITLVLGFISKKHPKISNNIIPIQNLAVGIVMTIIEFIITKNLNTATTLSGVFAGGTYDVIHNLNKIRGDE